MKKFLLLFLLLVPLNVYADSSNASIVMDVDSGRILYEKNSNSQMLIASTTKIMTCIIVLENSEIDDFITVGSEVESMYGTNIYIEKGEIIRIKDLLYGLMLRSGNDAAISLAVNTLGEEKFVEMMNKKAQEIGMIDTVFQNPHGLDDDTKNTSTAYDMVLLARYAYKNKDYRKIISTKKYTTKSSLKSYTWHNRMELFNKYSNCIGGKNGYTPKAGKSLVSYAKNGDLTLTIVSLNDSDIYNNHVKLYKNYFSKYKNYLILEKSKFKYIFENKEFYIKNSFSYPLKEKELDSVKTLLELFPKSKDGKAGKIIISNGDTKLGKVDVYEKKEKKKEDINIFKKLSALFIR